MTKGFWGELNKPIMALAPLYDVTDAAFRFVIAKYGKPDVMWTEFISADGLASEIGLARLKHHLIFDGSERPIVAQIFGKDPENYFKAAQLIAEMKFDGIDINLGCPDKNIMKQGSCAALFHNPLLVQELVKAAKAGAPNLPVSVKIRVGDTKLDWESWISNLLLSEPAAIAIHLRTRKEMSKVAAHWELMPKIVKFIHANTSLENRPKILGNGDVENIEEAKEKIAQTGADGVMFGRAIFGNPWLFAGKVPSIQEKMQAMIEHTQIFEDHFSGIKNFEIMKKHYKAYAADFDGAKELRIELMAAKSAAEVKSIAEKFLLELK